MGVYFLAARFPFVGQNIASQIQGDSYEDPGTFVLNSIAAFFGEFPLANQGIIDSFRDPPANVYV